MGVNLLKILIYVTHIICFIFFVFSKLIELLRLIYKNKQIIKITIFEILNKATNSKSLTGNAIF